MISYHWLQQSDEQLEKLSLLVTILEDKKT